MHSHSLDRWTHEHIFLGATHARNERRTWFVVALTTVIAFVAGAAILTLPELIAGQSIGKSSRHTTLFGGHKSKDRGDSSKPTDTVPQQDAQPSPQPTTQPKTTPEQRTAPTTTPTNTQTTPQVPPPK